MSISADVTFAIIPTWIVDKCSPYAVKLYVILWTYTGKDQRNCWPSRKTLAGRLGVTDTTLDKYVRELKQAGAVTVTHRKDPEDGSLTSNMYQLHVSQVANEITPRVAKPAKVSPQPALPLTRTTEEEPDEQEGKDSLRSSLPPHENDNTPYLVVEAFLEELGTENDNLSPAWMSTQRAVAKRLIADGFGVTKVRRCTRFMLSESWRASPFDLFGVEKCIGKWEARGAPEHADDLKVRQTPRDNVAIGMESVRLVGEMLRNGSHP